MSNGAISFEKNNIKFLHSSCVFDSCNKNNNGGSLYFKGQSSIVQYRFCAVNSTILKDKSGLYAYTEVAKGQKNIVSECSISQSRKSDQHRTLHLNYGKCGIFSSNFSKNLVGWHSGFTISYADGPTMINFSSFSDNHATKNSCLSHDLYGEFTDYFCNVKNCTQDSHQYGIIHCNTELTVRNCTIIGPYGNGTVFSSANSSAIFRVFDCNIEKFSTTNGIYTTSGVVETDKMNILSHLSTYKCQTDIPITIKEYRKKTIMHFYVLSDILHIIDCSICMKCVYE